MAYDKFQHTLPNPVTQNGTEVCDSIKENQNALVDAIVMQGPVDWEMSVTGGPNEQPTQLTYIKRFLTSHRLRADITYDQDGNPDQIIYTRSYNSGSVWETIGTKNIVWFDGAVVSISWS